MAKQSIDIRLPAKFVVFRYKDNPKEWHVTCLEAHAFGWGRTIDAAFAHLLKTIGAQFEEASREGYDALFKGAADSEWATAYDEGRHPALDDVVVSWSGEGEISLVLSPHVRAHLSGAVRIDTSVASKARLQSA